MRSRCSGQATVEVIGSLPAVLLVSLALFQLLAIGYAATLAVTAAEAGALAEASGRSAEQAARRAIPGWSRVGMRVSEHGGTVRVALRAPSPLEVLSEGVQVRGSAAVAR